MNLAQVKAIAAAVLYEGYLLYPYRRSAIKNRQRWTFGVVYPRAYSEATSGGEPWTMRSECLVEGDGATMVEVWAGFLHLLQCDESAAPASAASDSGADSDAWSPAARVANASWEEGIEREVAMPASTLGTLLAAPLRVEIAFPAARMLDSEADGAHSARRQQCLAGAITLAAEPVPGVAAFRLSVTIENTSSLADGAVDRHDAALPYAFVSAHTILHVVYGAFVSLLDPPEALRAAAASCHNRRAWPVLVGDAGDRDALLCSPIILYDYPQIALESPGALFDGTEIDEILTLRILALSDDEKAELRRGDARAREILERTEALSPEQMWKLHGAIRSLGGSPFPASPRGRGEDPEDVHPYAPTDTASNETEGVPAFALIGGRVARRGDGVWLHPTARADPMDLLLVGKTARIEALQQDMEDRIYVVVTLDDDPGREQEDERILPGHRFFFFPDELELLEGGP